VLPHPPDEKFDAILAEEGLTREHHGRHAPVPRRFERALVLRDDGVVPSGGLRDRDVERSEVDTLAKYLPASVSDDEIRTAVQAAIAGGAKNVGAVMGKVMAQFKGRAEGGTINAIAREELSRTR